VTQEHVSLVERRAYDLTLESSDYPPRESAPERTILLCSHQRSGSTLLGEAIHFARELGCPLEYFHAGFRPKLQERWRADSLLSYVRCVQRYRTNSRGVLAVKLFWQDIEAMVSELDRALFAQLDQHTAEMTTRDTYRAIGALLSPLLPNPTFIHLVRRDRVRQAVSHTVAAQTQVWRSIPDSGQLIPRQPPSYDYQRIADFISYADYCHAHWQRFFESLAVAPLCVAYEDLARDYAGTIGRVLRFLGRDVPAPPQRMRRQADENNENFVLRFLTEHCASSGRALPTREPRA
jgi:LPS sulfotransferase NodH